MLLFLSVLLVAFLIRAYRDALLARVRGTAAERRLAARFELRRVGNVIELRLEDFGNGGDAKRDDRQGFGITGMQERARLVGGECRVEFRPGRGTMVTARLPLPASDGDGDGQKPPAERRLGPSGEAISAVSAAPL